MSDTPGPLVSTQWLADHLDAPDVRVVDATYFLPMEKRDAQAEYLAGHIPGAVFFPIDEIADTTSALPHMLPPPEKFSSKVRKLGLGDGTRIVVYDARGNFSAPRVWWTFRAFGHQDVAVLDGGLPKWKAEGRPVEEGPVSKGERHFTARFNSFLVRDAGQVEDNIRTRREQVLDARAQGRFEGSEPEIWPGRRAGHIPGSRCLPFGQLLAKDGTFLPPEQLREKFRGAGIDIRKPVVTSCGSGITAAILALGLELAGAKDVALYDGSWAEWGLPGERPVETGPAS